MFEFLKKQTFSNHFKTFLTNYIRVVFGKNDYV